MKQRPILFSTPMVQAILNGTKNQTRRIKKEDVIYNDNFFLEPAFKDAGIKTRRGPYGNIGDILWVRESFTIAETDIIRGSEGDIIEEKPQYVFKGQKQPHIEKLYKWRPSIHMPKDACRIFLGITNIRVEKLHAITEEDAKNEGVEVVTGVDQTIDPETNEVHEGKGDLYKNYLEDNSACIWPTESFQTLWQKINGIESWDQNPSVWVIDFKVLNERNIEEFLIQTIGEAVQKDIERMTSDFFKTLQPQYATN